MNATGYGVGGVFAAVGGVTLIAGLVSLGVNRHAMSSASSETSRHPTWTARWSPPAGPTVSLLSGSF